jgi:hypothetical protein
LIASSAYSTWNRRPSGEKVFTPRSYSLLIDGNNRKQRVQEEESNGDCFFYAMTHFFLRMKISNTSSLNSSIFKPGKKHLKQQRQRKEK